MFPFLLGNGHESWSVIVLPALSSLGQRSIEGSDMANELFLEQDADGCIALHRLKKSCYRNATSTNLDHSSALV